LSLIKTSQPHFQVIEYAETHWRKSANLYVINIPDGALLKDSSNPIRQHFVSLKTPYLLFGGGIDQWRVWVDYWCKKPIGQFTNLNPGVDTVETSTLGRQKFSNQKIKNLSVPIFAYTKCGITPDAIRGRQLDAIEKQWIMFE